MGTHAVYGFKKDNKYKITYSNFDGGYNDIGTLIINFVNTTSITEMNTIFEKIVLVDVLDIPTEKQIQECKKYANLEIATRTLKDFVCLLAKTIGHLEYYRDENLRYMINEESELDKHEFQYIINLDNEKLEIYWYEMLVNSYDLTNVPKNWIEECDTNADICYQKWKSQENEVD